MKVQELLASLKNKNFNMEKALEIKKYLPIEIKKTIVNAILYEATIEENGLSRMDSIQKYFSYIKYMIRYHTNLDYSEEDYDLLAENMIDDKSVLDIILSYFQTDAAECLKFLNMANNDAQMMNSVNTNLNSLIVNIKKTLTESSGILIEKLKDFNIQDMIPDDVSKQQLANFLKTIK